MQLDDTEIQQKIMMKFHGVHIMTTNVTNMKYVRESHALKPNNELIFIVLAVTVNLLVQEPTIFKDNLDSCTMNTMHWFFSKGD